MRRPLNVYTPFLGLAMCVLTACGASSDDGSSDDGSRDDYAAGLGETQATPSSIAGAMADARVMPREGDGQGDPMSMAGGVQAANPAPADVAETSPEVLMPLPPFENPTEIVIDAGDGIAIQPSVAFAEDHSIAAAWCASTDENLGIWFALWNADGQPTTPAFNLDSTQAGIQNEPTVCAQAGGGFVVAWSQDDQSGSDNLGIRFRRLSKAGQPVDTADQTVTTEQPGNHWLAHVACDSTGGFTIVGVFSEANNTFGVFAQSYDRQGVALGPARTLNDTPDGTQSYPQVAIGIDDWVQVVWQNNLKPDGDTRAVFTRWRNDAISTPLAPVPVSPMDRDIDQPVIAPFDENGSVLIAATLDQRSVALYMVQADGQFSTLPGVAGSASFQPALAAGSHGEVAMIYYTGSGRNLMVNLARVTPMTGVDNAVQFATGTVAPYAPAIAAHNGRVAAAWTERLGARSFQIKIALFGASVASP
ncbi:MAG: hypothetical protein VX589_11945 [Myxococcota bacterium]|nr:hypothetical protein [Myxococcota bacterium]